jgi:hypothetical protein
VVNSAFSVHSVLRISGAQSPFPAFSAFLGVPDRSRR